MYTSKYVSIGYVLRVLCRRECAAVPRVEVHATYNGYRWIACRIKCGRQWLSIDEFLNKSWSGTAIERYFFCKLLWSAVAIDEYRLQCIVAGNAYRWTSSPTCSQT